jgi:hypothetical protein
MIGRPSEAVTERRAAVSVSGVTTHPTTRGPTLDSPLAG